MCEILCQPRRISATSTACSRLLLLCNPTFHCIQHCHINKIANFQLQFPQRPPTNLLLYNPVRTVVAELGHLAQHVPARAVGVDEREGECAVVWEWEWESVRVW